MRFLILILSVANSYAKTPVRLRAGHNQILVVPGVTRAAVADSQVLSVKAVPPNELLLTGKKAGETTVRVWREGREVSSYLVTVLSKELKRSGSNRLVRVSLEIFEIDRSFSRQIGFRWPDVLQISGNGQAYTANTGGVNLSATFETGKALFRHLENEGWGRLLANPDLSVVLGEEAEFHSGGEFPISISRGSNGYLYQHIDWKTYGITVKVLPKSADGIHIQSRVSVDVSEINRSMTDDSTPSLTKRTVQTKISARDGDSVVLSGLVKRFEEKGGEGFPFLRQIPILGLFFGTDYRALRETELLMGIRFQLASPKEAGVEFQKRRVLYDD